MADNGYDGSIVINTELDNDGFEKDSNKLLTSVDNLAKRVNALGAEMKTAFSGVTSVLKTLAAASNNAASGTSPSADQATRAAEQTIQASEQTAEAHRKTVSASSDAAAAVKQYDKELERLQKQIAKAEAGLSEFYEKLKLVDETSAAFMAGARNETDRSAALENEAAMIEELHNDEKYAPKIAALNELEKEYGRIYQARAAAMELVAQEEAQAKAAEMAAEPTQTLSEKLAELRKQIAAVKGEIEGYAGKVAEVKQKTDEVLKGVADGPSAESQVNAILAKEAQQLDALKQSYLENYKMLEQLRAEHSQVASTIVNQKYAQQQASGLAGALKALSLAFRENVTDEKALDAAGKRVVAVFGDMGRKVKTATKQLLKLPFKAIAASARLAMAGLKKFAKQAEKTGLSTNGLVKSLTSLKTMLVARIKRMFISSIFNDVGEGLKQLALFDSRFNATMSNMKNSLTQLKGNISAVVGNILSALEPIITAIINLMNKAVTAVNQFFAVLNGKSTYTAAKKGNEQFAESAEDAAEAQKKFNNELYSFDELNRQNKPDASSTTDLDESAIQFEELPVDLPESVQKWVEDLKSAWKNADWDGVGEVLAEGLNATLKKADDWINNTLRPKGVEWANRAAEILNGLFDNVDWPLLGKTVADGLNAIADIVNTFFTTFKAKNFGSGIGAAIKSWFDNIDWELIGQTFANKWNLLLHTIEGIVTTPGIWASIGQSIGTMVKSWFDTIDFNSIATSLIATFNGVTTLVNSFLDQNPFAGVAQKITAAINRVLHEVNWAELGAAIGRLFIAVLKNLVTVVQQIDWSQVGFAVGQALSNVDWGAVFAQVAQFIGAALKAMFEFLGGMIKGDGGGVLILAFTALAGNLALKLAGAIFKQPLQQALTSIIADLLKGIIGGSGIGGWGAKILTAGKGVVTGLIGKIGGLAAKFLPAIGATLTKIVTGIVSAIGGWPVVIIAAAAAAIAAIVIWIKNGGGEVIQGFIDGVKEKWEAVKQALRDFADLWITGFKNLFGIHSPSTVMAEQGGYVMDGLLQGVSDKWPKISEFLSNGVSDLLDMLSKGWDDISTNAKDNWENLKTNVTTAFENTKTKIQDTATQIGSNLRSKWGDVKSEAQTAWSNVKTTISNAFNNARTSVSNTASNMRSNLSGTFSGIVSNAQTTWGNLQTATLNKFSALQQNVMKAWTNLRTNLNNVQWNNVGHNLVAGLNNGVAGAWGGFMSNVSNMVNNLIRRIKNLFGIHSPSKVFAEIGEFLDAGLSVGMENGERGLLTTAKNIATAVTDGMTPDTPNVQMNVDSVVGSMQAIISSLGSLAVTFQTIASALNSIGGFTLPNIAAGKVVPYQTKVAANTAPAGAEGGVEAYLLGILAELQALSRSMRNGDGKQSQPISISIGGREVFQVVVDENNRVVRTTGKSPLKV